MVRVSQAVDDIPRERSTEPSDASRGLRVDLQDFARTSFSPPSGICLGSHNSKRGPSWKNTMLTRRLVAARRPRNQAWAVGGDCSSLTNAPLSPDHDDSL